MKILSGYFRYISGNFRYNSGNFRYIFSPRIFRIVLKVAIPHLLCLDHVIKLELRSWDQVFKGFRQLN